MRMPEKATVILADGDFPADPIPLSFLEKAERIVCCDGAALALVRHGMTPDAIVGDLDSLSADFRKRYSECLVHVEEQDDNDLTKAFRFCMEKGWKNIIILGATGKREDHTLGNLSLLADYSLQAEKISLVTDHGIFVAVNTPGRFESSKGEQISIFALDEGIKVTSENLKYPMKEYPLRRWWQATLNEALEENFSLDFEKGKFLLIFRAFRGRKIS